MEKFEVLQGVPGKLGLTAQYLWPKAVRYVVVQAVADMVGWALFSLVLGLIARHMLRCVRERNEDRRCDEDATGFLHAAALVLCAIAGFTLAAGITSNIGTLASPEWAVVKGLVGW